VVLDKLVKPANPITDYNTRYIMPLHSFLLGLAGTILCFQSFFRRRIYFMT
jgi:hypothetical protein